MFSDVQMFFDLFKVDSDDSKPKLFHINHVEVEHGLVVTQDEDQPEGLKVSGWKYERLFSAKSSLITRIVYGSHTTRPHQYYFETEG